MLTVGRTLSVTCECVCAPKRRVYVELKLENESIKPVRVFQALGCRSYKVLGVVRVSLGRFRKQIVRLGFVFGLYLGLYLVALKSQA